MRALRTVLLGVGLAVCTAAQAEPAVYFVEHSVRAPGHSGALRSVGYSQLTLEHGQAGELRMHTRPLWSQQRSGGYTRSTDDLDADDPSDAAVIDVLAGGLEMRVSADGTPGPLRAVDADAWARLTAQRPRAAQALVDAPQSLGLQARALPRRLQVGKVFTRRESTPTLGDIDTRLEVLAVDDGVAVLALRIEADSRRGTGRQAVRLVDGMPLDVRLRLEMDATDDMPATEQSLRMVAMDLGPMLDLSDSGATIAEYQAERLDAPPFSEQPVDPTLYDSDSPPHGVLLADMLDVDQVDAQTPRLDFTLEPRSMGRARIVLRKRYDGIDDATQDDQPLLVARVRSVVFRDAEGRPVSDLEAVPVGSTLAIASQWRNDEGEANFPFRLHPGTRTHTLEAATSIELGLDVETFAWDGVETVAHGDQPQSLPRARIDWMSAQRIGVEQPRAGPGEMTGLWAIAVPVDAEGRALPQASLMRYSRDHPETLDWEHRHAPQRTEIATPAPIAAVELRRYRWTLVPRAWTVERRDSVD